MKKSNTRVLMKVLQNSLALWPIKYKYCHFFTPLGGQVPVGKPPKIIKS